VIVLGIVGIFPNISNIMVATSLEETLIPGCIFLLGSFLQLFAATTYNVGMLCCVVVILLFNFVWNISFTISDGSWFYIIIIIENVISIYPVVGLISEIKSGIMSKETYPREAYNCCCVARPNLR